MNIRERIERIEALEAEVYERFKALKAEMHKENEFPQFGDDYWYVDSDAEVMDTASYDGEYDQDRLSIGNVFKTKQQAEFAVEKLKVEAELKKYSVPIFKGCYYIYMKSENGTLGLGVNGHYKSQGTIYFESEEKANEAIQSVGEDRIKKYIFGVED